MPIPLDHIKERLNNAYVSAVAARAGYAFRPPRSPEYGSDGYIQEVRKLPNGKYIEQGFLFFCQLKATTTSELEDDYVVYDMKVEAYNKLAIWEGTPCILVLLRLSENPEEWLTLDEEQLLLKKCCYWIHVSGPPSTNRSSQRIRIPRTQMFTPEAVIELMEKVKRGKI